MADKTFKMVVEVDAAGAIKGMKMVNAETDEFIAKQGAVQKSRKKARKGAIDVVEQNKGVSNSTNNSTHAFAKMAQQMNGIVPVYATVAANVFAITAAFGALERAADFKILIDSADTLAVQTGRSLTSLAENMKDITGSAISMKEALVQASIAASAGFDNSTIEQLTQVARNASVALGREMTDSLNRVFKGAIKAEPELLDELGIILRLETAANKYATTLGKTAKELTTFEKQQAVVNEVLEQGEKKFGRLAEVDPNPFTQLSAAFSEITITLVNLLNTPIAGFISFFTENIASLTAAIVLLATSVAKQALPALSAMGESAVASFTAVGNNARKAQLAINNFADKQAESAKASNIANQLNTSLEKLRDTAKKTSTAKIFDTSASAADRLNSALNNVKSQLRSITVEANKSGVINPQLAARREELFKLRDSYKLLSEQIVAGTVRTNNFAIATNVSAVAVKALTGTVAIAAGAMAGFALSMSNSAKNVSQATGLWQTLQYIWLETATAADKADGKIVSLSKTVGALAGGIGAGLLKLVPVISIVTIAFQVLGGVFEKIKKIFGFEDIAKVTEKLDAQADALNKSTSAVINYSKNLERLPRTLSNINEQLTLQSNVLSGIVSELKKVNDAVEADGGFGWWDRFLDTFNAGDLDTYRENIGKITYQLDKLGFSASVSEDIKEMSESWIDGGNVADGYGKKLQTIVERLQRFAMGAKEANQDIIDNVETLNKSTNKLYGSLPSLGGVDQTLTELISLSNRLEGKEFETVADTLRGMSSLTIGTLGLEKVADELKEVDAEAIFVEGQLKAISAVIKELQKDTAGEKYSLVEQDTVKKLQEVGYQLKLNLQLSKDALGEQLIAPLSDAQKRFEEMSNSARKLKGELSLLGLDKLNAQNTSIDTISILREETALRLNAIRVETKSAKDGREIIRLADEKLNAERKEKLLELASIEDKKNERAIQLAGELGTINRTLDTNTVESKKLQLKLDKDIGKSASLVSKLFKETTKEINAVVSLQASGVTGLQSKYKSLDDTLKASVETMVKLTGETEEWGRAMLLAQKYAEERETFLKRERIASTAELQKQTYNVESANMGMQAQLAVSKQLNNELFTRADAQWQVADATSAAAIALQQVRVNAALDTVNEGAISPEIEQTNAAAYQKEKAQLDALVAARAAADKNHSLALRAQSEQTIQTMRQELSFLAQKAQKGSLFSKMDKEALAIAKLKASLKGNDPKDIKKIIALQKQLNKETRKFSFSKELQKSAEAMNELADGMTNLFDALQDDQFDNFAAGLMLLQDVGDNIDTPLGNMAKGFATAALASEQYADQLKSIEASTAKAQESDGYISKLEAQNIELQKQQANYQLIGNAAGALAGAFEEGSAAAKVFALAQQGAAIASAATAIAQQGQGDPYSAFARIAAMIALMSSVLGAAGIAFSGGGSGSNSIENDYENRLGSDALLDRDLQGNYLIDALDDLVAIDTQLFSATRDLQITMKNLGETFARIGAVVFASISGQRVTDFSNIGEVTIQNGESLINSLSNVSGILTDPLGLDILGGLTGDLVGGLFGSTAITKDVIDTGIDFKTLIQVTEDGFAGQFTKLDQLSQVLVKTESESLFGLNSSSSTSLQEVVGNLDSDLAESLGIALDQTITIVNGLVTTFASAVGGVDIKTLFGNVSAQVFGDEFISLFELNATDAGEAIGLYFSALSSDLLGEVLPFLQDYVIAGEELGETMTRLTANTIKLNNSFSTVGQTISSIIGNFVVTEAAFVDIGASKITDPIAAPYLAKIATLETQLKEVEATYTRFLPRTRGVFAGMAAAALVQINQLNDQINTTKIEMAAAIKNTINTSSTQVNSATKAAAEAFRLEVEKAWEKELYSQFKDEDEFYDFFDMFSKAIFSEAELLDIAVSNATSNIENGFAALISQVDEDTGTKLLNSLQQAGGDFGDALRLFYEDALDTGLFNAEVLNGTEINTTGAAALSTVVQLGAAINQLDELMAITADTIEDLNNEYVQQILLFGKLEKQAALLSLAFDFEAALMEAEETGTNIALVEQAFALERLAIVKEAFDLINNEISDAMGSITDAIIEVSTSSDLFDDIAFSTIKINKLVEQLAKGSNNLNLQSLVGDTTGLEDFIDNFQDIIDTLSTEGPGSVSEEIGLVDDLNQAILDRYNSELDLLQQQEQAYKDLSVEIQGYLNDIILSDQSPLTNFERLNEAESQFLANAANIFSGDEEIAAQATQDLLSSADAYLEAASGFFSIGPEYAKIFDQVTSVLSGIDIELLARTDETVLAIEQLNDTTIDQLMVLDSILLELQSQNQATLETDIVNNITEGMVPLIGTITDKLQSIDDGTWTTIVNILNTIAAASDSTYESVVTPTETFTADILVGDITAEPTTGFAVGTAFVPEDMIANVHYGEVIIPESMAQGLREGTLTLGDVQDNREVVEAIKELTGVLAVSQEDIVDAANKNVSASIEIASNMASQVQAVRTAGVL